MTDDLALRESLKNFDARQEPVSLIQEKALEIQQTKALTTLSEGIKSIAEFLTRGGLAEILSGYARSQAVKEILGGLAAHDGRGALDGRVLQQNAIEIVTQVEKVFEKYQEKLEAKGKADPEIHDGEADFRAWVEKQNKACS